MYPVPGVRYAANGHEYGRLISLALRLNLPKPGVSYPVDGHGSDTIILYPVSLPPVKGYAFAYCFLLTEAHLLHWQVFAGVAGSSANHQ